MPKIILERGNISNFEGDAIICYSDTDISYKRNNLILQSLKYPNQEGYKNIVRSKLFGNEKEDKSKLLKELSAIGHVEIGNAVITKAYDFNVRHFIFVPYIDHDNESNHINSILLHQALRSAFTLATVYDVKRIAVPILRIKIPKKEFLDKIFSDLFEKKSQKILAEDEVLNITTAIAREFTNKSLQEIVTYR
jgi:hypothetical protein